MPFLYVYSPTDFVEGLPDESGAAAAGTPGFTLTLKPDASPTIIEVSDNDAVFDEVDSSQSLASSVTIDGDNVAAGTSINSAYDLIDSDTGHKVTSFHLGGDGYQQGAVDGIASTVELTPGTSYTFDTERTSHMKNNLYTDFVSCFTPGTQIATVRGPVPVEALVAGDLIHTADHGPQPLRAVLSREISAAELAVRPQLAPIRLGAGALGAQLPDREMYVSPQHRFVVTSPIVQRMFGTDDALIAACKLQMLPGIDRRTEPQGVTYFHLVLDRHEVIFANGAPTESLYLGPCAVAALAPDARRELEIIFPDLSLAGPPPRSARLIPTGRQQSKLVFRHDKNRKPLRAPPPIAEGPAPARTRPNVTPA